MGKSKVQTNSPLIKIVGVKKYFPLKKTKLFQKEALSVKANDGIDLVINKGETLGLVGESGCGKSTLGRVLLQLYPVTKGKIIYYGYSAEEYAPKYLIKAVKNLNNYKNKYNALLARIPVIEKKIEEMKKSSSEKALREQLSTRVEVLKKANEDIYNQCIKEHGTFIVSTNIKEIRMFPKLDSMIFASEHKIAGYKAEIRRLQGELEKAKTIRNPQAEAEIAHLKKQLEKADLSQYADLNKQIAIAERKAKAIEIEIDLQIRANQNNIVFAEDKMKQYIKKIKAALETNVELDSYILRKLVEYKERHYANEQEINKCLYGINYQKELDEIANTKLKLNRVLDIVSNATGGLILCKDIAKVTELLLGKINYSHDVVTLKQDLKVLNVKKYHLEKKLESNKEKNTNLQNNNLVQGINEVNRAISEVENNIAKFEKTAQHCEAELEKLKETIQDKELFTKLEANKETGIELSRLTSEEMRVLRKELQLIFQDPYSSLNPRMTVGQIINEGMQAHNLDKLNYDSKQDEILKVMEKCGLAPYMLHRYPHQFSGGQRQRIGIARALAVNPTFVVCDEAVSALDVSIQSQIINLLEDLRDDENLTYLFISHDLSVIKHISDRIGVMYLGKMVELGDSDAIYQNPLHPYTKALISSIPTTEQGERKRIILEGDIPSNVFPPSGCKFRTRCPMARPVCAKEIPEFREVEPGRFVACHFYEETKNLR